MSDENSTDVQNVEVDASSKKELTVEQMAAKIAELENRNNDLASMNGDIISSRDKAKAKLKQIDAEAEANAKAGLLEKEEFKTLYEDLKSEHTGLIDQINGQKVDSALSNALKDAGITSVQTALKIMDKSNIQLNDDGTVVGMQGIVDSLKADHAILFVSEKPSPTTVVPSEDDVLSVVDIDFNKLDMKNPKDRAKYSEYRKANGIAY